MPMRPQGRELTGGVPLRTGRTQNDNKNRIKHRENKAKMVPIFYAPASAAFLCFWSAYRAKGSALADLETPWEGERGRNVSNGATIPTE